MEQLETINNAPYSVIPTFSGFLGLMRHIHDTAWGTLISSKDSLDHGNNAPSFVLVHGFSGNHGTMTNLGERLKEHGNVIYAPSFPNFNTASIRESSKLLNQKIIDLLAKNKLKTLRLIGFSNGGLIALDTLRINTGLRVDEVITMGTPFKGTPLGYIGSIGSTSCHEINQEGGYLGNFDASRQLRRLSVHVSMQDNIVPPRNQIPHPRLAQRKIQITHHPEFTHTDFLDGKAFIKKII